MRIDLGEPGSLLLLLVLAVLVGAVYLHWSERVEAWLRNCRWREMKILLTRRRSLRLRR